MFSTRNSQAAPGVKNFGMQGPSKGFSGVRVFKGPTLSSFNLNPFSSVCAHFDTFDVGYRPSQSDLSQRLGGPPSRNQQQSSRNWQAPNNIYAPSNLPPPPPQSHTYQQNPMPHFGICTGSQSSASHPQEQPRHREAQQQQQQSAIHDHSYYIHPGISTDMYIYEASDAFSEYSPSPSPSIFSPALSTDSTMTLQSPSPLPSGQSGHSQDQGRSATPFSRATAPAPSSGTTQSRAQSPQPYTSNSFSSNSNSGGVPFPSSLPGIRQAQNVLRGILGSNGQAGPPGGTVQTQSASSGIPRVRTVSDSSSNANALPNSELEFDDLARMNTALNAGYSFYFPEPKAQVRSRLASTSGSNQRSPRDSLMFYNGGQQSSDNFSFSYSQAAPLDTMNVTTPMSDQTPSSTAELSIAALESLKPLNNVDRGISAPVPALEPSISSSSQSSELSILRTPSPTHPSLQPPSRLQSQSHSPYLSEPLKQGSTTVPAAYTTVLSASPEPQLSPSPSVQVQAPAPLNSSGIPHLQSSLTSNSVGNPSNVSPSLDLSTNRDRAVVQTVPVGRAERHPSSAAPETSPSQGYPMPRVAVTDTRSFNNPTTALSADPQNTSQPGKTRSPNDTYGDLRNGAPPTTGNNEVRRGETAESNVSSVRTRKSSNTTCGPENSPPRIYSQPSQTANSQPRSLLLASTPAHPQQVLTRVRKDSMSLGMKTSSSSHPMSRSSPSTAPSYPSSNIGAVNGEPNGERLAHPLTARTSSINPANPLSTTAPAVPTHIPSSFPEPRRRHSDGDNPSLTDATRRTAVPFQSEFVPAVSVSSGSHSNRDGSSRNHDTLAQHAVINGHRPEPTRTRSSEVPLPTRPGSANPRPVVETLHSRCVRWNEELICPSPIWPSQRRKGWFNRRGDQLWTNGGAFRSPPEGGEYPPDLDGYPEYGEGWMNEEGTRIDMAHRLIPKAPLRSALKTNFRANGSHC